MVWGSLLRVLHVFPSVLLPLTLLKRNLHLDELGELLPVTQVTYCQVWGSRSAPQVSHPAALHPSHMAFRTPTTNLTLGKSLEGELGAFFALK